MLSYGKLRTKKTDTIAEWNPNCSSFLFLLSFGGETTPAVCRNSFLTNMHMEAKLKTAL